MIGLPLSDKPITDSDAKTFRE
jgi:hypothetical protein